MDAMTVTPDAVAAARLRCPQCGGQWGTKDFMSGVQTIECGTPMGDNRRAPGCGWEGSYAELDYY